jgi:SAM-dependent methyltransferase
MRDFVHSLLDLHGNRAVLDIGCGKGYDLRRMGERLGCDSVLVGVDSMEGAVAAAREEVGDDPRLRFMVGDVSGGLPFGSQSFDLVYSRDFLECVTDRDAMIREVHRVLKPGGQVAFVHYDWDSQIINGSNKSLIRKIVHEFADWKQGWMVDCDGWMGRRLWGAFNKSGLFDGSIQTFVITNTEFDEPYQGHARIHDFSSLVSQGKITAEEYSAFLEDIKTTAAKGEYFYSVTTFIYIGQPRRHLPTGI